MQRRAVTGLGRARALRVAATLVLLGCMASPDADPDATAPPDAAHRPPDSARDAPPDSLPHDAAPPDAAPIDATPVDAAPHDAAPHDAAPARDALPDTPDACCPEPEPPCGDDAEAGEPIDLGSLAAISHQFELIRGQDLEVPIALNLCAADEDWFAFWAHPGEHVTVWATSVLPAGGVTLEVLDAGGDPLGQPGAITAVGAPPAAAHVDGTQGNRHFIAVRRPEAGEALPYTLFVRIDPAMGCESDSWEVGPGAVRNDTAAEATVLVPTVPPVPWGTRYELDGEICNLGANDRDWYRFPRPAPGSRTCITADFVAGPGELVGARVFLPPPNPAVPPACLADLDCDAAGDGLGPEDGLCVQGVCVAPDAHSAADAAPALVEYTRGALEGPGDAWVLVEGIGGAENAYDLTVSVNPSNRVCVPDARDNPGDPAGAEFLGNGQAGVCDAWLCNDQQGTGDWYSFDILPGTLDRTVLVTYRENADGRVGILPLVDGVFYEEPFDVPSDPLEACLNIRASALGGRVTIGIMGDRESAGDGDEQIDYTLRILPTDLALDPDGRCDEFVGAPMNVWEIDQP